MTGSTGSGSAACFAGVGDPIKVQEGGEVPVTQPLVDQLAQPVFRQAEPQGELTDRQPLLTIGSVDGQRPFEGNGQRWVGRRRDAFGEGARREQARNRIIT